MQWMTRTDVETAGDRSGCGGCPSVFCVSHCALCARHDASLGIAFMPVEPAGGFLRAVHRIQSSVAVMAAERPLVSLGFFAVTPVLLSTPPSSPEPRWPGVGSVRQGRP